MMKTPQNRDSAHGPPVRRRPQHAHRRTSYAAIPPGADDSSARQTGATVRVYMGRCARVWHKYRVKQVPQAVCMQPTYLLTYHFYRRPEQALT